MADDGSYEGHIPIPMIYPDEYAVEEGNNGNEEIQFEDGAQGAIAAEQAAVQQAEAQNGVAGAWTNHALESDNVFQHDAVKERFQKQIEVLSRAEAGKKIAKDRLKNKDFLQDLTKALSKKKDIITAWLLKRESLSTRVFVPDTGRLAYAKIVITDLKQRNPQFSELLKSYDKYCSYNESSTIAVVVKHFVNMHIWSCAQVTEYLRDNNQFVTKMDRLNSNMVGGGAAAGQNPNSARFAISLPRVALRVILDMLIADYTDIKYDVVIDNDDQYNHYDLRKIPEGGVDIAADAVVGQTDRDRAQGKLDEVLNIVARRGGNKEALRAQITTVKAEWSERSFVRNLIGLGGADPNVNANPTLINSENDATDIVHYYMFDPAEFTKSKAPEIINARLSKLWRNMIDRHNNENDPGVQALVKRVLPPIGLLTHEIVIEHFKEHLGANQKMIDAAAESGIVDNVVSFISVLDYCYMRDTLSEMNLQPGVNQTEEFQMMAQTFHEKYPEDMVALMQSSIDQVRTTLEEFERLAVADRPFANPSALRPGSALSCFPDYCDGNADYAQIAHEIGSYLSLSEDKKNYEDGVKNGQMFTSATYDAVKKKMQGILNAPEDLNANAEYWVENPDAPWIDIVNTRTKVDFEHISRLKAVKLEEETERQVREIMADIRVADPTMTEEDARLFESKLTVSCQKPAEAYKVTGKIQTLDGEGKPTLTEVEYIPHHASSRMKAAKANIDSLVNWKTTATVLSQTIKRYAAHQISLNPEGSIWRHDTELTGLALSRGVLELLTAGVLNEFFESLYEAMKTSLEDEAKKAVAKATKKRRRVTDDADEDEEAMMNGEANIDELRKYAKKGKLVIKNGQTKKKRIVAFTP